MPAKPHSFLEKYFYFSMSILIAVIVTYGFSHTIGKNLIHPPAPRPGILWLHATIFFGWLVFYIVQSGLVRTRHTNIHKTLGWFGVVLAAAIVTVGVSTAITMGRFHYRVEHQSLADSGIGIPFFDIACFATTFTLAVLWRRRPEFHRRLILLASAALSAAGWGRYPLPPGSLYLGVDFFLILGIIRDLIVNRRIHKVYAWGLPAFVLGQAFILFCEVKQPQAFQTIMRRLIG